MEQDISNSAVELAESRVALTKTRTTLVSLQTEISVLTKSLASVEAKIAVETAKLSAFAEELGALDRAMKGKKSDLADGEIEVRRNEIEGEKLRKEVKAAAEAVTKMERTCDWISSEYQYVSPVLSLRFGLTSVEHLGRRGDLMISLDCRWETSRRSVSRLRRINKG